MNSDQSSSKAKMRSGQAGLTTSKIKNGNDDGLPTIAALYVETNGAYFGLEGVDPWDEMRDARLYDGPFPVVAQALRQFLAMCRAARRNGEPWIEWIDAGCPDVTTPEGARFASPRGAARRREPAGALL